MANAQAGILAKVDVERDRLNPALGGVAVPGVTLEGLHPSESFP